MKDSGLERRSRSDRAIRLLLIDDNPHDRELLGRELGQRFEALVIEPIRDATEFQRALREGAFDAVVVDYQIHWSTGLEALRAVKQARPECPVLMFTASGSEEIAVEAMKEGLDDYVTKSAKHYARLPFALEAALERAEQKRELERGELAQRALMEQLAEGQQRLEMALHAARMVAWQLDLADEHLIVSANSQEIVGTSWTSLAEFFSSVYPPDLPKVKDLLQRAQTLEQSFRTEVRVRGEARVDEIWLEIRGQPLRDSTGVISRVAGVAADVTEHKRAMLAITHLAAIVESSQDAMVSQTLDGIVTSWNEAARQLYGYTAAEMIGQPVTPIIPPQLRAEMESIRARLKRGERIGNYESQRISKDGRQIAVSITLSPLLGPDEAVIGASAVTRDISDRIRVEEELRAADRRKDALIATLAHELRNPLAPIRYATRLLEPGVPVEMAADARRMIDRQLAQMARLLDDLLDVSRMSRGVLQLRREVLDLREVIQRAVAAALPVAQASQLSVDLELPTVPLLVTGDATRLEQVLGNLLSNAIKYGNSGGQIYVAADMDHSELIVRVRDNGIGIPAELLPRVFDMFVQAEPIGSRAAGGLGIGLSLARELVQLHDGRIDATSEGPGRGSEFVVRLPRAAELPAVTESVAQPEKVTALHSEGVLVLIVDDNADAANALSSVLTLVGFKTQVAYAAAEALAKAASQHPQIVLLDIGLPDISGHQLAQRLRAEPWGADLQLIAITGWGQEDDRRKSLEAGFDQHLTKPVDPEQLISLIARSNRSSATRKSAQLTSPMPTALRVDDKSAFRDDTT
jgi:PAS domain S-box-containing protein